MRSYAAVLKALGVLFAAQAPGLGCGVLHDTARPAAYGIELAACTEESHSWNDYVPCCVDVAARYGRDPSFCFPKDGGR